MASLVPIFSALQKNLQAKPTVLVFIVPGDQSEILSEFYIEIQSSYNIEVLMIQSDSESFKEAVSYFSIAKVPTSLFIVGMKVIYKVEGAEIPELFETVEKVTSEFPGLLESRRSEEAEKIESLARKSDLVVFLKGNKEKPKSRRSLKAVRMLNGYDYATVDVTADRAMAEWVKAITGSLSFPLYFLKGAYAGTLENLIETTKNSSLFNSLGQDLNKRLTQLINSEKYIVVMMGSREEPICGFSKRLIELLNEYNVQFNTFDISIDNDVCEGLKLLSNWPTYPQVYVEGELIGGLDVCLQMHNEGTLREALKI